MIAPTVSPAGHGNGLPGQGLVDLAAIMCAHTRKKPTGGKRAMLRLEHGASKPKHSDHQRTGSSPTPLKGGAQRLTSAPFGLVHRPLDRPFRRGFSTPWRVHPRRALAGAGTSTSRLRGLRRRLVRRFVGRLVLGRRVLGPGSVRSLDLLAVGLLALAVGARARRILA